MARHEDGLGLVVGEGGEDEAVRVVSELLGAGSGPDPGHPIALQERQRGEAVGGANPGGEGEHAHAVYQLAHGGHGAGRVVTVVARGEHEVTAVDAALVVDVLEVRVDGRADRAPGRCGTGLRTPVAYDYLVVGDALDLERWRPRSAAKR